MSTTYTIFCVILGETTSFSVDIASNKTVDQLKKKIKEEKPNRFAGVDADELALYDVNISGSKEARIEELKTMADNFGQREELDALRELTQIYSTTPPKQTIHIIVQTPQTATLKWRRDSDPLGSPDSIETRLAKRREHTNNVLRGVVPSSVTQSKVQRFELTARPVYNRPPVPQTIPLALLHDVFGKFMHDVHAYKPTQSDNQFLSDLREKMVEVYDKESKRCTAFRAVCEKYELSLMAASVGTAPYQTDGDLRLHGCMMLVTEGKNDWDHISADPVLQAALYHIMAVKEMTDDEFNNDNFPCLLVYYVGSFIGFAGCLISDLPQVELLTPFLPFNTNTHETEMSSQLARALGALRLAVQSLKIHYTNRHLAQKTKDGDGDESSRERHTRLFYPYKTCYISNTGAPIDFRYLRRMDSTNLLFLCETTTTTATTTTRKLCIKFTRKYSPDAHQYCATNGVAPELYAVESLPGGWIMVVMDYLDEESYKHLLISHVPQVKLAPEVQRVVSVLHAGGFVHGDIRGVNLMVRRNWKETDDAKNVLLVDFDWAGPTGSTYYPPNVNRVDIPRPDGAKDGEPISKEHDLWMVEQIVGQESVPVDNTTLHMMDVSQ